MALAQVPTRSVQPLWRLVRCRVWVRRGVQTAALLGTLASSAAALAQLPPAGDPQPGWSPAAGDVLPPPPSVPAPFPTAPGVAAPAVPMVAPTLPTIRYLPPAMSAQASAGMLELLVPNPTSGQLTVVTRLPLPSVDFATLCIGEFLYVARGDLEIVVLDVHDPMQPRQVGSFLPGGRVHTLWGGSGSLLVGFDDGMTALFDISSPAQPRYQSVIAPRPAPRALAADPEPPRRPPERAQHRLVTALQPFLYFANRSQSPTSGGAMLNFSYQYAKLGSLWWGIEFAPLVYNNYYPDLPTMNSRVWFGYAGQLFGLAAALGSGVTRDEAYLQLGPALRIGRLNGVHSTLRLMWSALAPLPYPSSAELNIEGPLSQRLGLRYNFTGDSALNGFYTTLGLQLFAGGDHRWRTTVLTPGLGFTYMRTQASFSAPYVHHPGVIFSFAVEPRW